MKKRIVELNRVRFDWDDIIDNEKQNFENFSEEIERKNDKPVNKTLNNIIVLLGFMLFLYVGYRTLTDSFWMFFLCLGPIFFVVGVMQLVNNYKKLNTKRECCTTPTIATIVDVLRYQIEEEEVKYLVRTPIYKYTIGDMTVHSRSKIFTNNLYTNGDKINILYNPDNPWEFLINDKKYSENTNFIGIVFIIMGLLISAISTLFL